MFLCHRGLSPPGLFKVNACFAWFCLCGSFLVVDSVVLVFLLGQVHQKLLLYK